MRTVCNIIDERMKNSFTEYILLFNAVEGPPNTVIAGNAAHTHASSRVRHTRPSHLGQAAALLNIHKRVIVDTAA